VTDVAPSVRRSSVLTLGESMVRLALPEHGRSGAGTPLSVGIGGAESNVAIAVTRLGVSSTWMSRLGDDDFGSMIARELLGQGVRVIAARDPAAPTGLLVKEHRQGRPSRVRYYRAGSAASRMSVEDLDEEAIRAAGVLHVTGITPALGPGPTEVVHRAVDVARAAGTLVSFDLNYRSSLWSPEQARPVLGALLPKVDVVFAGLEEANLVVTGQPVEPPGGPWAGGRELAARLSELGPDHVVIKLGEHGALSRRAGAYVEVPAFGVTVVDPVGAGDAFVGGYLGSLVAGQDTTGCLQMGARLGALVCGVPGDWEGLLDWEGPGTVWGGHDVAR
jgi:2-dehydro-3-deoxygluconokinase